MSHRDPDRDRNRDRDRDRNRDRGRDRDLDRERESRDADSKRQRSGFERQPSPKRSRRDGKLETERERGSAYLGDGGGRGGESRGRRLQDALPLENSRFDAAANVVESEKTANGNERGSEQGNGGDESKHVSDPTLVPRSRSYFQHDERGNPAQAGRSFGHRSANVRHRRDPKDGSHDERATNKYDSQRGDRKSLAKSDDDRPWRHDGFFKMEAEPQPLPPPPPPARKRPAFTEKKVPVDSRTANAEPTRPNPSDHPESATERREERDRDFHRARYSDRYERPTARARGNTDWGGRGVNNGNYRNRDGFGERQGYRARGTRAEKWKHDLFDEANKSPTAKNEEDHIAKVEALLGS